MKKYYSLVAITTLSVALLGNATSTGALIRLKQIQLKLVLLIHLKLLLHLEIRDI
ncbi:MAG: hypothetical protein ACLUOJ_04875 [Streptococcus salivarius]